MRQVERVKIKFVNRSARTRKLYQGDKGYIFDFLDDFQEGTELQFEDGSATPIVDGSATIPDSIFEAAGPHKAWVQVVLDDSATTVGVIKFEVVPVHHEYS